MQLYGRSKLIRLALLGFPLFIVASFIVVPLIITLIVSFWKKVGFSMAPAFSLKSYILFFQGTRLEVLERTLFVAFTSTVLMLVIAYSIAYIVTKKVRPEFTRAFLFLFAAPFLVNYIIRTFAWSDILGRTGPINTFLFSVGITKAPLDWLLFSDFAVYLGLITAYMPFMIFPIWLSLSGINERLFEASWMLGEAPLATFWRITLPLSMPGVLAAAIFGFVGAFGEVAISLILGGTGYQLIGNTIQSSLDILNYPLAAAISSLITFLMLILIGLWFRFFDIRLLLGKIMGRQ